MWWAKRGKSLDVTIESNILGMPLIIEIGRKLEILCLSSDLKIGTMKADFYMHGTILSDREELNKI